MDLLTPELRAALRANAAGEVQDDSGGDHDPVPLVKFFNPMGAATWLATELGRDDDTLFGLADLGFGCPELGYFSLSEIAGLRLPFGLGIERDLGFGTVVPLSVWAEVARGEGSILGAQAVIRAVEAVQRTPSRPSTDPDGGQAPTDPDPLPPAD